MDIIDFGTGNDWDQIIAQEQTKNYFCELNQFLDSEYSTHQDVWPSKEDILNSLKLTPISKVKVVIVGQDPYPNKAQAMGLSFSVPQQYQGKLPASLKNIQKEIKREFPSAIENSGCLAGWASQGVLLLNRVLTYRKENTKNIHKNHGWEIFTVKLIRAIEQQDRPIIYMLWGVEANKVKRSIVNSNHCVLSSSHPSPYSAYRGFFGCNHFVKTNAFLTQNDLPMISWTN